MARMTPERMAEVVAGAIEIRLAPIVERLAAIERDVAKIERDAAVERLARYERGDGFESVGAAIERDRLKRARTI